MRILVASASKPFAKASERETGAQIAKALRSAGHQVDTIWLPVDTKCERWPDDGLAISLVDVSHACEMLVAVAPLAALLEHPRKVVWCDARSSEWLTGAHDCAAAVRRAVAGAQRVVSSSPQPSGRLLRDLGVTLAGVASLDGDPAGLVNALVP